MNRLFATLTLIPSLASATPYDGVFKQTATADCSLVGEDGHALEIRDGIFYGVEVQCRMSRPVSVVNMDATLYDMQCSGEGQNWTERAMVMQNANRDGIIMLWDGYAFVYEACEQPSSQTSE